MFERIGNVLVQVGSERSSYWDMQPRETSSAWSPPPSTNKFMRWQPEAAGSGLRWKAVDELELEDRDRWLKSTDKVSFELLADS